MRRPLTLPLIGPVAGFCAAIVFLSACTPEWLSDYSGFLFVKGDGSIALYDMKTKKAKVLIPRGKLPQWIRPSLSPDGKKIALARLSQAKDKTLTLRILLYDLKGKQLRASAPLKLGHPVPRIDDFIKTIGACYWSPDGKRIVTALPAVPLIATYETAKQSFRLYRQTLPATMLPNAGIFSLHVSPITPDSKGFLAIKSSPDYAKVQLGYYGWDEKKPQPIAMTPELKKASLTRDKAAGVVRPPRWEFGKLVFHWNRGRILINPKTRKTTFKRDADMASLYKRAKKQGVVVIHEFRGGFLLQMTADRKVQFWDPDKKKAKTVVRLPNKYELGLSVVPAPNNETVLLHDFSVMPRIIAIDATGRILATIDNKVVTGMKRK